MMSATLRCTIRFLFLFINFVASTPTLRSRATQQSTKTLRVQQEDTGRILKRFPHHFRKAYQRYSLHVSRAAHEAAGNATGSAIANAGFVDSEYLVPIRVGNTGQKFMVNIDTGSADFWLFSTAMEKGQQGAHDNLYGLSGEKMNGSTFHSSYLDGEAVGGDLYSDTVVVGGVTATSQAVAAATYVSFDLTKDPEDGIMGLGFRGASKTRPRKLNTFMDNVLPSLQQKLFTSTLRKQRPGSYDFGFIDDSKYTGTLNYSPVSQSETHLWSFSADGWSAGSEPMYLKGIEALVDTGSTLVLIDEDVVSTYWHKVSGATFDDDLKWWIFPCKSADQLPDFSIFTNGRPNTVPGSYINFGSDDGITCYGGIQSNAGMGLTILGDIFLKSQFVVFDYEGPRIGFAAQAGL